MTESIYLIEDFVSVKAGEPFRLFPFGRIVKGGKVHELTRALAEQFRLPHFKPPIKRGSHDEAAPAGGHIVALEVRDDGLYAVPEYNEQGEQALENGDYRYHSPEVIWDGWLEDPATGDKIEGPMIVGDALLHTPHLGEATALYSVVTGEKTMTTHTEDMVSVTALERLFDRFGFGKQEEPEPKPNTPEPQDDFVAQVETLQAENEQYKAKVAEYEAAQERLARVDTFATEFDGVEVGHELFSVLADVPEDAATQLVTLIKAIAEQARVANLTEDVGDAGADSQGDPTAAYHAAVTKVMDDREVSYPQAVNIVNAEQPDVFNAYAGGK